MSISRRNFIAASAVGATSTTAAMPAQAATPNAAFGIDATDLGLKPDAPDEQTMLLQRAIDRAARERTTLILPAGTYRCGELRLPSNAKVQGIRGATRIELTRNTSLFTSNRSDNIDLSGLVIDGGKRRPAEGRALLHLVQGASIRITDCEINNAGRNGISLEKVGGMVSGCTIEDAGDGAVFAIDSTGLVISGNVIRRSGNNGIQVWRSAPGDDGTLVIDNRVEDTRADAGGDGPYGNAISVFRAGNVMVRGNRIDKTAFSAIRGNSANNIQITGNTCTRLGEVAIYSEFSFEGAVIANNTVDGAAAGISVTNFDVGGRLATVTGNLLRNLNVDRPGGGLGIAIAADSVVSGNVIEKAPEIGIAIGYGPYLRDVIVSNNVVRGTGIGIVVSVVQDAGTAMITDNLIAEASNGAIVGMEWDKRVTGDMAKDGVGKYTQLTLSGNRVR
jgi:uncharacterized secreted repeat protein (TIGR03808 family)